MTARLLLAVTLVLGLPGAWAADGTVTGTVRVDGPVAPRPKLPVFKHAEVCGEGVDDDRLVVGPGGGLRYAVVVLDGVPARSASEAADPVVLDNVGCRFVPHVQAAQAGQVLEMQNSDPILHNVDARQGKETLFNVALPPARRVRKTLSRPGLVAITCDVRHTWMSAFVVVVPHGYHAVTDAYGAWEIRGVPPGRYTLRVWHEELGTKEERVEVREGGVATVDVAYAAP